MTIKFADGTRIEVPASAYDAFVKYDLKWVEFVHGRAERKQILQDSLRLPDSEKQHVHLCLSRSF